MSDHNPFGRVLQQAMESEPGPERQELYRVAGQVRRMIEALVTSDAPLAQLERLGTALEGLASDLEGHTGPRGYDSFAESANAGTPYSFFDHSPLIGSANPLAPPAQLRIEGDRVVGHVRFGSAYEGPPGHVHGGYLAAVFDELLGMAQSLSGQSGMTGTLSVRYRRPTPLHRSIDLEGEVDRVEGRKVFVTGRSRLDGEVTAESDGVFISIDTDRFRTLLASRGSEPPVGPAPDDRSG